MHRRHARWWDSCPSIHAYDIGFYHRDRGGAGIFSLQRTRLDQGREDVTLRALIASALNRAGECFVSTRAKYALTASAIFLMLFGANLPTPLYELYRALFGLSPFDVTIIYSVYALVVIIGLPVFGKVSDIYGRDLALLVGLSMALGGAIIFSCAMNFPLLLMGRIVQGIGVGITSGAATAALVELHPYHDRQKAALTATIATVTGSAAGPLFGGALAEYSRSPERLPFILYGLAILPILAGIARCERAPRMARVVAPQSSRMVSIDHRWPFLLACATAFMAFVVPAVFLSLGPSYLATLLDAHGPLIGGAVAFLLLGASAFAQITLRRLSPQAAMPLGVLLLAIGLSAFTFAWQSLPLTFMLIGTTLAGFGHGIAFTGSLAFVNTIAPMERRGFVTSILYVAIYAGGGIPILALGFGASRFGIPIALEVYTSVVALACLTLSIMLVTIEGRKVSLP